MTLTLWTTAALVLWIVLWSIGAKAFDAFMLTLLVVLLGATGHILKGYIPGRDSR